VAGCGAEAFDMGKSGWVIFSLSGLVQVRYQAVAGSNDRRPTEDSRRVEEIAHLKNKFPDLYVEALSAELH
jgi:hypothetical protein